MADEEVATKAPESDLAEQSAIPGDSAVDQGASLGVRWDSSIHRPLPNKVTRSTVYLTDLLVSDALFPKKNSLTSIAASGETPTGVGLLSSRTPQLAT